MPSIRLIVTDPNNLVADKTVEFTQAEWALVEQMMNGWKATQIANPAYNQEDPESPPTIDAPMRWNVTDQVEAWFDRGIRACLKRNVGAQAAADEQAAADAAKAAKVTTETGDDVPVRVEG